MKYDTPLTDLTIVFAGTPEFASIALTSLLSSDYNIRAVYTQPDRPAGRGRKLSASPVKHVAQQHGLSVMQPETLKDADTQRLLSNLNPDLMVVVAYGLLLPLSVLQIPRFGCINIHASLLPRWRGAAPIQRAILAGDETTGITIMQMDQGLDTGDILYQSACPIHSQDTAASLHDRLAIIGGEALLACLKLIETGNTTPTKQVDDQACYAKKLDKQEAAISWSDSADVLDKKVRAFNPWPVAYSSFNNKNVRIWKARSIAQDHSVIPGVVTQCDHDGFNVATGKGQLRIEELQLPGARRVSARDFLNANKDFLAGVVFGPA